jgi:DNA-binding NtrC family response regulator
VFLEQCGRKGQDRRIKVNSNAEFDADVGAQIVRQLESLSPSLLHLREQLVSIIANDMRLLLLGEPATGKIHLARLIHECSRRRNHPFLIARCDSLSASWRECLFGYFSRNAAGVTKVCPGMFEAAGEGTIVLQRIDSLTVDAQASLLPVLKTTEFEPVGAIGARECRARIMATSSPNLEEGVERGAFRCDLYYCLSMLTLRLPPLRERVADIAPLSRVILAREASRHGKDLVGISPKALALLEAYPWPGNIDELESALQHSVLVSAGMQLQREDLPPFVQEYLHQQSIHNRIQRTTKEPILSDQELLERSSVERALQENDYVRAHAAQALGISRVTLYKKMRKYGLTGLGPAHPSEA